MSAWHLCRTTHEMEAFYLSRMPAVRDAAKRCGYAIGLHGSLRRDLDLIAVPWIDTYATPDALAEEIQRAACGFTMAAYQWESKPNGRIATAFPICRTAWHDMVSAGHIDLSVIGTTTTPPGAELLPCPWCREAKDIHRYMRDEPNGDECTWFITCENCGCYSPAVRWRKRSDDAPALTNALLKAWNTRTAPVPVPESLPSATVEEYRQLAKELMVFRGIKHDDIEALLPFLVAHLPRTPPMGTESIGLALHEAGNVAR